MAYHIGLMTLEKEGKGACFLWKINSFGEVTTEWVDSEAPGIASSSRGVMCMGSLDNHRLIPTLDAMISNATDGKYHVVPVLRPHAFNVDSLEQLVERLNSKGNNIATRLWSHMPFELRPAGIAWNSSISKYEIVKDEDDS